MPYVWLGLMVLMIIIEAATLGLTTIWFAIGSLFAFLVSLTSVHPLFQFAVFLLSSIIMLFYTRPIAKKFFKIGTHATNAESFIGREGIVIKPIEKFDPGQVKVWGQIWTAVSENGEAIPLDSKVRVKAIEGVKLVVEAIDDANAKTGE
ncbi:MAG: NfeD family protein [Clostridiaceae bacterium]|nr:NfeD family protein [Clostridiaceae bacterium]